MRFKRFSSQSLESQLAQEKIDVQHLTELLSQARDKAEHDKEALKKATRSDMFFTPLTIIVIGKQ